MKYSLNQSGTNENSTTRLISNSFQLGDIVGLNFVILGLSPKWPMSRALFRNEFIVLNL